MVNALKPVREEFRPRAPACSAIELTLAWNCRTPGQSATVIYVERVAFAERISRHA